MTVTKVGGANMIAHAQWPLCPPFPRVAVFYVTPAQLANQATSFLTVLFITGNPCWIRPHQRVWQVDIIIN